ncbi:MAG: S41 family peptidase [Bacteroidales bacterium]|jgi:C-terminal processing protease CtpA/Prc
MRKLILLLLLIPIFFVSCRKKEVAPVVNTDIEARDMLYDIMNQYYLWYDSMPAVVKDNYSTPYTLLDAMMYKVRDKWSFIETYDGFLARYTGTFVGHGILIGLDPSDLARIAEIYKGADLYSKGVRRGWIIKTLNGTDLAPILLAGNETAYDNLIGPSTAGITNTFVFQTPAGKDSTITTTKESFTLNTVIDADTFHLGSEIVGHIVFDQFIPPANDELNTAFGYFQNCNITKLIVDLRYNGGGDLGVLTNMASYIAGSSHSNSNFVSINFNNKNSDQNSTYKFVSFANAVNVSQVVFITTRNTASASEDLINGLKPVFTDLITLGDTTDGKPVGMVGMQDSIYYMFWPIMFKVVNSLGNGDFYSGFAPAKYVIDDITHDFSDRNEACLKEALYYLQNGTLSSKGAYIYRPSVQFSERPERFNNAFILNRSREFLR